jgi:D-tyrosyl-tRNA(Tyr) deacylase
MKAIVQRVSLASVSVDGETVGEIGPGLLVLVAAHKDDTEQNAKKLAERIANLRIFNDADGKMNLSLSQVSPEARATTGRPPDDHQPTHLLAVPNFTVLGDTTQRRPSFVAAAPYERGEELFDAFVTALRALGVPTETGRFGADMKVALTNDGPVTVIVEA